jgi:aspartate carbamoyltransferase catalytic subunit
VRHITYVGDIKNGQIILISESKWQLLASFNNTLKVTKGESLHAFQTVMNNWENNIKMSVRASV